MTRGNVIAVWGPAGAPGRTTMAITIAAELAAAGYSVVLADADTHSGSIAAALGLLDESPGFAAACRLARNEQLTISELERIADRYRSPNGSFWVLTGIGRPSRWPELSDERVALTLDTCRDWVDFTVVDLASSLERDEELSSDMAVPRRNAATLATLRVADQVVAVGAADPVGVSRFLRSRADLLEAASTDQVTVLMNRLRAGAIGLNPAAQIHGALERFGDIREAVLIPHDLIACDTAVLIAKTLTDAAPKSTVRLAIRSLVADRISTQVTNVA